MFTKLLALFLLPALAAAQAYGPPPGPAPASSSASATSAALTVAPTAPPNTPGQINIDVAFDGMLKFNPPNITAPVGTLVTFYFPNTGLNHSVTQSTFANPCTYLAANTTSSSPAGFDSGLQSASMFTINVTDTNPVWYFCKHVSHCSLGMVGSINAQGDSYTQFLAAAMAVTNEALTPDNGPVVAGVDATATGPPVPDLTGSSSPSSSPSPSGAMKVTTSLAFALVAAVLAIAVTMAY